MPELGFRTVEEMVGRSELLNTKNAIDHWKAKGGCEYSLLIPGADMSNLSIEQIESALQAATKEIEKDDRFYREYVVGRPEVLEDGQLTEFEQNQVDYDGEILYPPEEIVVSV